MKKLLALLLLTAFLLPDAAWASYSCFGTNKPCDLTNGIRVGKLDDKAAATKKSTKKKTKKSTKKKASKKHTAKKPVHHKAPVKHQKKKVSKAAEAPATAVAAVPDLPPVEDAAPAADAAPTIPVVQSPIVATPTVQQQ